MVPALPVRPRLGSVHLLETGVAAPVANEQRIRFADGGVGAALLVTGYSLAGIESLAAGPF